MHGGRRKLKKKAGGEASGGHCVRGEENKQDDESNREKKAGGQGLGGSAVEAEETQLGFRGSAFEAEKHTAENENDQKGGGEEVEGGGGGGEGGEGGELKSRTITKEWENTITI